MSSIRSAPASADVGHAGKGREEQFAPSPAAQTQGKSRNRRGTGGTCSRHTVRAVTAAPHMNGTHSWHQHHNIKKRLGTNAD